MVEAFLGIQIISVCFAIFMLYVVFLHYKRENIKIGEFLFWFGLWIVFSYFALNPRILNPLLAQLFVSRVMDLLSIVAFMILAYLGFQNHIGIKVLQRNVNKLTRKKAISNIKKTGKINSNKKKK